MKTKGGHTPADGNAAGSGKAKPRHPAERRESSTAAVSGTIEAGEPREKPVKNLGRYAKKVVAGSFAQVMKTMAKKSEEGSLAHTKFLFEIGGVKEKIQRESKAAAEPSLACLLVAEIRRQHAERSLLPASVPEADGEPDEVLPDGMDERGDDCGVREQ